MKINIKPGIAVKSIIDYTGGRNNFFGILIYIAALVLIIVQKITFPQWTETMIWTFGILVAGSFANDVAGVVASKKAPSTGATTYGSEKFFAAFGGRINFYAILLFATSFILFMVPDRWFEEAVKFDDWVGFVKWTFGTFAVGRASSIGSKAFNGVNGKKPGGEH